MRVEGIGPERQQDIAEALKGDCEGFGSRAPKAATGQSMTQNNDPAAGPARTPTTHGFSTMASLPALLRAAANMIEAAHLVPILASPPACDRPRLGVPLPLHDPARTTRRYVHTDHPRLLPRGTLPEASKEFDTPAFRERWQPGDAIEIYCAAGSGYKRVARNLCLPFYKLGVTGRGKLVERFKNHKRTGYASFWWQDGRYVEDEDFYDQFPSLITTSLALSPNSPVRATANSIVVTLPEAMSPLDFEFALRKALDHVAVHRWLATNEGLRHCAVLRVDPAIGIRMTGYGHGDAKRMSPADEIYLFRPRVDGDELIVIIEQIILVAIGLADPAAPAA